MKKIWIGLGMFLLILPVLAFSQVTWKPYEHDISFKIKNAGVTVTGRFGIVKTELKFSPDKLAASSLKGYVEVPTIKTGIDKRDKDLQEEKYFNSGKYKLVEVASTKLYKKGNQYAGEFNITIKGETKQMEIPFEFYRNGNNAEFKANFTINRRDFGVGGDNLIMSDEVNVTIIVKAKS